MNRLRPPLPRNEKGQSIVIVALLLSFVFLALAALAVDGTIIYLRRRQLQNIADAAALTAAVALSQNKTEAQAYQAAMDSIAANEGWIEWYSTSNTPAPPTTNVGSGLNLTSGIEITSGCDVRVALQWSDLGTYFAQFVGHELLQVGARARAGCNRAGGLQPIAVKRFGDQFDWDTTPGLNAGNATIYCDSCSTQQSLPGPPAQGLGNAHDFLRPIISDTITQWPGWPDGTALYQSPTPHADLAGGAPGRDYFILGGNTDPNVGTVSYAGLINLDIRHVSVPPVEYYNGVTAGTNSNTLKDLAEYYIRRGYCCDIPEPGDQVAMYNGASASFGPQAMRETYAISDVVAVIVYDGHVFNTPNLAMTGSVPNFRSTHPTTTTVASDVLTYSVTLQAQNGFQSAAGGVSMNVEGLTGFADWGFSDASPIVGRNGINQQTITLYVTPTVTTVGTTTQVVTGTRMFYVSAIDDKMGGTNVRQYWAGIATIGDTVNGVQRDLPAVTGTPTNSDQNYPFLSVAKGGSAKYALELDLWGGATTQNVTVSYTGGSLPTGFSWASGSPGAPPWTRSTNTSHPGNTINNVKINISNSAVTSATPYELPFLVTAAGGMTQTFKLYIIVKDPGTTPNDYVEILGYAALQITGYYNGPNLIDPNDPSQPANGVRGRIVSRLVSDPSELTYGLRARLIPWEQ